MKKLTESLKTFKGISKKGAQKIAIDLIQNREESLLNINVIKDEINKHYICSNCNNVMEQECDNCKRSKEEIYIVESIKEAITLRDKADVTSYIFVLGFERKSDYTNHESMNKVTNTILEQINETTKEVVVATTPSLESDLLARILKDKIIKAGKEVRITRFKTGIPFGGSVEYYDEKTIKEAMKNREKA